MLGQPERTDEFAPSSLGLVEDEEASVPFLIRPARQRRRIRNSDRMRLHAKDGVERVPVLRAEFPAGYLYV
jgi:hypothetical protein